MAIRIEGSEKTRHTLKGAIEIMEKYEISWDFCVISRCPRCSNLFISKTERKYCSKECQYNRYRKDCKSKGVEK